jgi:serine/threonine protein kinase
MIDFSHICPNCCTESGDGKGYCPACGVTAASIQNEEFCIPVGTILLDRYFIGKVIGQGGFGITYTAYDTKLKSKVAIKEFYPHGYAFRRLHMDKRSVYSISGEKTDFFNHGLEKFISEAQRLAQFSGAPGIVSVRDYFNENNTAYIIMEFVEGEPLGKILEKRGSITEAEAAAIFLPILKTLKKVHTAGILHRDIAPDNIMVQPDGTARLIDFGASAEVNEDAKTSAAVIKHFYVPEEQYDNNRRRQGAWTDVYAIAATIFRAIEGETMPDALERLRGVEFEGFTVPVSAPVKKAVMNGLALFQKDRSKNVDELIEAFSGILISGENKNSPKTPKVPKKPKEPKEPNEPHTVFEKTDTAKKPSKLLMGVLGSVAVLAVCAAIFIPKMISSIPAAGDTTETRETTAPAETVYTGPDWLYSANGMSEVYIYEYKGDYGDKNYIHLTAPAEIDGYEIKYIKSDVFKSNTEGKTIYLTIPPTYKNLEVVKNNYYYVNYTVIIENAEELPFPENFTDSYKWVVEGNVYDVYLEGGKYSGKIARGKPNGFGIMTYDNGETAEGNWVDGVLQTEETAAGTTVNQPSETTVTTAVEITYVENIEYTVNGIGEGTYTGDWGNNKPEGKGVFKLTNGGTYDCEWVNGKPNGQGTMTSKGILTYTGGFKNGQYDGQGTLELVSGQKYVGEFKNGKKHGKGIQYNPANQSHMKPGSIWTIEGTFENGEVYGDYIQTEEHTWGTRIEYRNTDDEQNGTYTRHVIEKRDDGSKDEFDEVFVNGNSQGNINQKHPAVEKDVKNYNLGWGNGELYTGHLSDNQPNGKGTMYRLNNPDDTNLKKGAYQEQTGTWKNGTLVGDWTEKNYFANGDYEFIYHKAAADGHNLGERAEDGEVLRHVEKYNSEGKKIEEFDQVWKDNRHIEDRNHKNYE